jgi:hypothetical protein
MEEVMVLRIAPRAIRPPRSNSMFARTPIAKKTTPMETNINYLNMESEKFLASVVARYPKSTEHDLQQLERRRQELIRMKNGMVQETIQYAKNTDGECNINDFLETVVNQTHILVAKLIEEMVESYCSSIEIPNENVIIVPTTVKRKTSCVQQ